MLYDENFLITQFSGYAHRSHTAEDCVHQDDKYNCSVIHIITVKYLLALNVYKESTMRFIKLNRS